MKEAISYTRIIEKLQTLCADKCSGVLLLLGPGGQTSRIHLADGKIVALISREKKGYDAIPELRHLQVNSINFIQGLPSSLHTPLPDTDDLLRTLTAQTPLAATAATPAARVSSPAPIGAEAQASLRTTLAQYVGPVADLLCDQALQQETESEAVIINLAKHIPNSEYARRFLAEMRTLLAA